MTQPNQSELEQKIDEILLSINGATIYVEKIGDYTAHATVLAAKDALLTYITANYTLTSEVVEREQEAYRRGYIDGGIAELTKDVT